MSDYTDVWDMCALRPGPLLQTLAVVSPLPVIPAARDRRRHGRA